MSKNSQDEPDEYDAIFDGANADSAKDTTIEVSDGDVLGESEYIDAEIDETAGFTKVNNGEAADDQDQDIDDGIFAPARRDKAEGKKSSSLMWAVSLLAFVGVGAFVYVSNPDILSKVTSNLASNLESSDNLMLPNEVAESTSEEDTTQAVDHNVVLNLQVPDSAAIVPDAVVADTHHDVVAEVPSPQVDAPASTVVAVPAEVGEASPSSDSPTADVVAENAATLDQSVTVPAETLSVETPPVETLPVETPVAEPTPVAIDNTVAATVPATEPTVVPAIPDTNADVAATSSIPSYDVITPINEEEPVEAEASPSNVAPSVVAAPTVDTPVAPVVVAKENVVIASAQKTPTVTMSKEEKRALDNANLDKYFDSPNGKILKDIPAPSMNPRKGGNESIIVVNKKGQKTETQYSKPAGKVTIEATSLNAQLVSANRALKLGRYDAAKEMYDELYRLNPRDGQILAGRAVLLQKMGFADQAISAYEELLKLYPDNTDAIVNLSGLIRKQYPAVALNKLLDLQMKHPNNVAVTAQLGVAYADSGNYADALRYLGNAAAMDPKNALHFYNMAVISEKASKPDQAISYYEKALEIDSIYGEGYNIISRERIYDRLAQIRRN